MAEHKYISLKDLLKNEPSKHGFRDTASTADEEEEEEELDMSLMVKKNPNTSSSPTESDFLEVPDQVSDGEQVRSKDKGKNKVAEKDKKGNRSEGASKVITRSARFSSMRHSRSDEPLVHMGRRGKDSDAYGSAEDLGTVTRKLRNFSWEDMAFKSKAVYDDSDDE